MDGNLRLAITSGEPAGIGPDICLVFLHEFAKSGRAALKIDKKIEFTLIGDGDMLHARAKRLGISCDCNIEHVPLVAPVNPGKLNPDNAQYVLATLRSAVSGCEQGRYGAMITAPVHKGVINDAGIAFSGHTEYLAALTNTPQVVMMLAGTGDNANLRVALATTHLPLKDVSAALTEAHLSGVIKILLTDLRDKFGYNNPRVLVAGLNPHAGEDGHMGREEIEVITPQLNKLREQEGQAAQLIGPLPADTMFTKNVLHGSHAQLVMYHDQGLPVLKYAAFDTGINITLGLPIIRTSVDHGTALDLAAATAQSGKCSASHSSLAAAVAVAAELAANATK